MKVEDLIKQMQKIEQARPGLDFRFQSAENIGNGFATEALHLLSVHEEPGQDACCIALGTQQLTPMITKRT
ncbi:MAG: hypothetical protein ACXWIU_14050 [Limisphaerales bacterium]